MSALQPSNTSELPVTYWPQLVARFFQTNTPAFYKILQKNALILSGVSVAAAPFTTHVLPSWGITPPLWMTIANAGFVAVCAFFAGVGLGGAGVAQTTIQTVSTPVLITKPVDPMAAELAEVKRELIAIKQAQTLTMTASDRSAAIERDRVLIDTSTVDGKS